MALDNLREFIKAIEAAGELVRVSEPVRARLEVAEIADRCMKSPGGGPALLFEHVLLDDGRRASQPVAINLYGSMRRMCLALGVDDLETVGGRISELIEMKVPEGLFGKLAMLPKLAEVGKFPPKVRGGRAPCQEVVLRNEAVNLDDIPFLTTWPGDGGRYITLPMVITRDPARGIRNVGMYRIQVLGKNTLAMHWQRHKVGAAHWREMASAGERMPASTPAPRRFHRPSTSFSSPASSGGIRSSSPRRSPAIWRCRRRRSWCSRATSIRRSRWCSKAPSATTRASTPWRTTIRRCT
jgi:4-hydroxy-3-polyprenylbenzoate decarboxylase